jgi:phage-related protein
MALENEEIQRMMEDAANKVQGLGTAAGTAAEQEKKAAIAQAEFTANLQKSVKGLSQMGATLTQGGSSFKVLGDSIQGVSSVISGVAKNFGMFGKAFAGMADGVGAAAKFVTDQLDQMSKNYGALGDAGAIAADGISGMQRQFEQMGNMSLPAFTKAINENSMGMAAFGGSVAEGAEQFSTLAGNLTRGEIGQRFLKLGMTFDQVGESASKYASNTARYGGLQNLLPPQFA